MISAYDKDDIIATDQVPNGITVTAAYSTKSYLFSIAPTNSKTSFRKKSTYDNMPSHIAQPVINLFIDYTWETLHHP